MIHLSQLTKENGFADGVMVEIVVSGKSSWGVFSPVDETCIKVRTQDSLTYYTDCIESIRPLTGPMAIWNFAPEWAESCITGRNGVYWIQGYRPEDSDWPDLGWEKITFRPWWAK